MDCDEAKKFWTMVHEMLHKTLKCVVPFKQELFLLNIMPAIQDRSKTHIIVHISAVVRLIYAQMWKCIDVPNLDEWKDGGMKLLKWTS